jgi:hypothetical protein
LPPTSEIERRIRRFEDRFAIQDLAVRFMVAIDGNDYSEIASMFTDKGTFGDAVGGDQVVAVLESMRVEFGRTLHYPDAHLVDFDDDDHAHGTLIARAELDIRQQTFHTALRYLDEYERGEDGVWRFASRTIKVSYAVPVTELAASMTDPLPVRWPGSDDAPADEL